MPDLQPIVYDNDAEICTNCCNFNPINETESGTCRAHAPQAFPYGFYRGDQDVSLRLAVWPIVHAVDWCGEFKHRYKKEESMNETWVDQLITKVRE